MDTLTEFGTISAYEINVNKSAVMPLNASVSAHHPSVMFKPCPNHITYIGFKISNKIHSLLTTHHY